MVPVICGRCLSRQEPASGGPLAAAGDPREETLHNHVVGEEIAR
jgi:hypothetical protein